MKQDINGNLSENRSDMDHLFAPELPLKARTYEEGLKYSLAVDAKSELCSPQFFANDFSLGTGFFVEPSQ